ncbi:hypothetical protein K1719_035825 [Acacia pycnantha]|nr:hypothetical protein K1719_035825 [Acacia pycnantha]
MKAEYPPKFQYLQFLGASINCVVISWLRRSATWLSLRLQSLHLEWCGLICYGLFIHLQYPYCAYLFQH